MKKIILALTLTSSLAYASESNKPTETIQFDKVISVEFLPMAQKLAQTLNDHEKTFAASVFSSLLSSEAILRTEESVDNIFKHIKRIANRSYNLNNHSGTYLD